MVRLLIVMAISAAALPAQSAGDEAAVKAVVGRYVDAREKRDAAAIEAVFTEDADQLISSGEWRKGREAVVRGTLASSESTGGRRTITVETVRFVAPNVALAGRTAGELRPFETCSPPRPREGRATASSGIRRPRLSPSGRP